MKRTEYITGNADPDTAVERWDWIAEAEADYASRIKRGEPAIMEAVDLHFQRGADPLNDAPDWRSFRIVKAHGVAPDLLAYWERENA